MSEQPVPTPSSKEIIPPVSLAKMLLGVAAELGFLEDELLQSIRENVGLSGMLPQTELDARLLEYQTLVRKRVGLDPRSEGTGDEIKLPTSPYDSVRLKAAGFLACTAMAYRCDRDDLAFEYLKDAWDNLPDVTSEDRVPLNAVWAINWEYFKLDLDEDLR